MRARFSPNGLFRSQSNKDNENRNSMGNAPSLMADETASPAGPQRLTKPRTNTNSAFIGVPRRDSDSTWSTPSKPSSRGTTTAVEDRQFESAESPLSFYNESPLNLTVPGQDRVYYDDSPSSSASNLARVDHSPRASARSLNRHSVAVDGSDMDIGAAIALLQQLKSKATPEEIIALHKALLPTRSVDPDVTDTILETAETEETVSPLIRRASLLPAGLATRISLEAIKRRSSRKASQEKRRRSTSQVPRGRESGTWEQFVEGGFDALDPSAKKALTRPGAATPSDFEPTHIGNYQLGSLRVTNGAASPEPRLILDRAEKAASVRTASGDGFVTADEGESSNESAHNYVVDGYKPAPSPKIRLSPGPKSVVGPSTGRSMPKTRSAGPLKVNTVHDGSSPRALPARPLLRHRASDMAQDYVTELDLAQSPFEESAALTSPVSRLSPVQDNSPVDDSSEGPEDALKKLTGATSPDRSRQVSGASDSSASRPDLDDHTHLQAPRRPSIKAQSDSGYSSETSWQAQARAHIRGASIDDMLSTLATATQAEQAGPRKLPMPVDDELAITATTNIPAESSQLNASTSTSTEGMSPRIVKQHKKLQKTRPQSQQLPSNHTPRSVMTEVVPVVPENVSVNFSRRLVHRPGMAHLEQTFTSVDQVAHKDHEAASVNVTEGLEKLNRDEEENRGRGRRQKPKDADRDAETPKSEKRMSFLGRLRSRSRSKSQHRASYPNAMVVGDDEPMPSISDFGTVAQSLGGSPYDIATRQVKNRRSLDGSHPIFHPHEITSELTQPKVNMDDQTAAQFARMKSRDIAEQKAEEKRARSHSRSRRHIVNQASPMHTRPEPKRSASAHPSTHPSAPTALEHQELPERPRPFRVGTIKFEGGEAQGRMSPVRMERPKTTRRTQSVSPRVARSDQSVAAVQPVEAVQPIEAVQAAERPRPVRVGTIQFEGGEAQGRFSPTMMQRPKTKRRTKSSSPRGGQSPAPTAAPGLEQETRESLVPDMPRISSPASATTTHASAGNELQDASPASLQTATEPPNWEAQARLWRERKKNLGEALSPATEKRKSLTGEIVTPSSDKRKSYSEAASPSSPSVPRHYFPTKQAPRHSPAIVVSRYVTPTSAELEAHVGIGKAEDPYAEFHMPNPTHHIPAKEDVDRIDSAISTATYKSVDSHHSYNSYTSTSSQAAPTPNYKAYRPSDAVSMAKLTSPPQQRRSHRPQVEAPRRSNTAPDVAFDRYSGGLGYGWEGRGVGFGGSAGTRQKNDQAAHRKSVQLSESFGVDLSDVPVFLTRA